MEKNIVVSKNENVLNERLKEVKEIENEIIEQLPIKSLGQIFPRESYIIGGSIRDVIFQKSIKISDIDVYTRCNKEELLNTLSNLGFSQTVTILPEQNTYYIDENGEYLYLNFENRRIEVRFIGQIKTKEIIFSSDINLNCCAFDINRGCLIDGNIALSIKSKKLEFSNPEIAKEDPSKAFSALKQIARFPELKISPKTEEIIRLNIQKIYEYYSNNPEKRNKLKKLLCEINSSQVLSYFNEEQKIIFYGLDQKPKKLDVSSEYFSYSLNELSGNDFKRVYNFMVDKYGKRFNPLKMESQKVNSVVFDVYNNGEIRSCCLFDGLRLYAIASSDIEDIVKMVEDILKHNRSIWTTISVKHKLLINLSIKAGLKIEQDKEVIYKILSGQYSNYLHSIDFNYINNRTTFSRTESGNPEQVLLRS